MRATVLRLLCLLALGWAAVRPAAAEEIQVFAAASLTDALQEIAAAYEKKSGDRVLLNLAASSALARQIQEGAPADLFFSADESKMDALEKDGLLLKGTRRSLLSNTLVVVVPADSRLAIRSARDLAASGVRALALADPQSVPAGLYAREYLESLKLWGKVAGKVVPTENVRAALAAVEAGNVEAGIVYRTDARISTKVKIAFEMPAAQGPKISYPLAILAASRKQAAARKLLAYLESPAALHVFRRHGFLTVPSP